MKIPQKKKMKKTYSINWEDDQIVSVEVNGIVYNDPHDISDPDDREAVLRLINQQEEAAFEEEGFDAELEEEFQEAFRQLERDSARFPKLIMGIFLLISLILLSIAAVLTFNIRRSLARQESVPGQVVELVARKDSNGRVFYYPMVEFYLPDERRQTVTLSEGSSAPLYAAGEDVTILYDREQPSSARLDSGVSTALMWIGPLIIGFVGLAFLAGALFVYWFFYETPRPEEGLYHVKERNQ